MTTENESETLERLIHLGHISAGVGHHVINALSAIVSNAELLRLDPPMVTLPDPVVLAATIIDTALGAATVARRLIDYTRPITSTEPERAAFQPRTIALDQLVADVVASERAVLPPAVRLETELAPIPLINGHDAQLRSMLACLLQNAYESLPSGGGVVAIASSTDSRGWNVLELRDSGRGMTAATLERAVEPFFSTKPGRLGVGLSVANGIWRRHRGTLSIQSRPDEGTRLRLCVEPTGE